MPVRCSRFVSWSPATALGGWTVAEAFVAGWVPLSPDPGRRARGPVIHTGHSLVLIGGWAPACPSCLMFSTPTNTTSIAKLNPDGSISQWIVGPSMNHPRMEAAAVRSASSVFVLGGRDVRGQEIIHASIERAAIMADGTIGSWEVIGNLPNSIGLYALTAVFSDGYVYVLGGTASAYTLPSTVHRALVDESTGSLGHWELVGNLPYGRQNAGACTINGHVVMAGGYNGRRLPYNTSDVVIAELGPAMSFRAGPSLQGGRTAAVVCGTERVYVVGGGISGERPSLMESLRNSVEVATFSGGTLRPWVFTNSLPHGLGPETNAVLAGDQLVRLKFDGLRLLRLRLCAHKRARRAPRAHHARARRHRHTRSTLVVRSGGECVTGGVCARSRRCPW